MKARVIPDGTILHEIRVPFGYWEAKDTDDDLDAEIEKKRRKGYPHDNIIFEDSRTAVLIQDGGEVMRCGDGRHGDAAERLLDLFFALRARRRSPSSARRSSSSRPTCRAVLEALREMIDDGARATSRLPGGRSDEFLEHATRDDQPDGRRGRRAGDADPAHPDRGNLRQGLRQRRLPPPEQRRAGALRAGGRVLHRRGQEATRCRALEPYYAAIRADRRADRQPPREADLPQGRSTRISTRSTTRRPPTGSAWSTRPNEIVRFMIEGADWLCEKHFGKSLIDKDVEILDPATGTGTFICELLEHFRGQPRQARATSTRRSCTPTRWRSCPTTSPT